MIDVTSLARSGRVNSYLAKANLNNLQNQGLNKLSSEVDTLELTPQESKYTSYNIASVLANSLAINSSQKSENANKLPSVYDMDDNEMREVLEKVQQQAKAADYSSMSEVEIYREITQRYQAAFGADFMDGYNIGVHPDATISYSFVISSYEKELKDQFERGSQSGSYANIFRVARQANYGNMSSEEIKQTIMEKYPPVNQMTYRDALLMTNELRWVGEGKGFLDVLISEAISMSYINHSASDKNQDLTNGEFTRKLMNEKFDINAMLYTYNCRKYAGSSLPQSTEIAIKEMFGISPGPSGMYDVEFNLEEYFKKALSLKGDDVSNQENITDWWNKK